MEELSSSQEASFQDGWNVDGDVPPTLQHRKTAMEKRINGHVCPPVPTGWGVWFDFTGILNIKYCIIMKAKALHF